MLLCSGLSPRGSHAGVELRARFVCAQRLQPRAPGMRGNAFCCRAFTEGKSLLYHLHRDDFVVNQHSVTRGGEFLSISFGRNT